MDSGAPKTERFEMRAPTDLLRSVDDWRRQQPDLPSRSEAIRRLIEAGLKAGDKIPIRRARPKGGSKSGNGS